MRDKDFQQKIKSIPKPPNELVKIQTLFTRDIQTEFDWSLADDDQQRFLQKKKYTQELVNKIYCQKQKDGRHRISVYNGVYWFRLLTIFQDEYFFLCHFLGLREFNKLVMDYLRIYPSDSYSLSILSKDFLKYLQQRKDLKDIELMTQIARLEWEYICCFDAKKEPPLILTEEDLAVLKNLKLQPHVYFWHEKYNFLELRNQSKSKQEFSFDDLKEKESYYLIFRDENDIVSYLEMEEEFFLFVSLLQKYTIEESVEKCFEQINKKQQEFFLNNLQEKFKQWTLLKLFCCFER